MAYSQAIQYDAIRSIAASTFTGSYQTVGSRLTHPATIVKFVNNTNQTVTVSTDGINDMDVLPANSFALYDLTANLPHSSDTEFFPKNTQFLVKASSGTGSFYVVILYIAQL